MNLRSITLVALTTLILALVVYGQLRTSNIPPIPQVDLIPAKKTMQAFSSDAELKRYFRELAQKQRRLSYRADSIAGVANDAPAEVAKAEPTAGEDESVTNIQHAGVDEGGIVKVHGKHLVMLRRGRLFTVAIGDGALQPISASDAFGPEIDPRSTWYDEMLVSNDTVAVIGYSYERGGTEVGLFQIDDAGKLTYRSTYHLRSNDYYSSRNYASRLIGSKLIFYTPLYLDPGDESVFESFPAVRRWHKGAKPEEFQRIVSATNVYRPAREFDPTYGTALHTVTVCDLANGFDCNATGVLGPSGRVFYVSANSVYVWVSNWTRQKDRTDSMLYRLPLDGSGPSALGVAGSPVDQFSFLESDDNFINVLVRSNSAGDGMWDAETVAGDVALFRAPLINFSDGSDNAPPSNYRKLPKPSGYTFQNRFIGSYVLYGTGSGWGEPEKGKHSQLFLAPWAGGDTSEITLVHGVDRIETMGRDAVVVGTDGKNLHFTSISLSDSPAIVDSFRRKDASQGELRSHGFFYKADSENSGTLGLPISVPGRPGYRHLFESSAAILFLRNDDLHFEVAGELAADSDRASDDNCRASCIDWYGNARPLFVQGRVLALLGYEIVEGKFGGNGIREVRRVSYAPGRQEITRN